MQQGAERASDHVQLAASSIATRFSSHLISYFYHRAPVVAAAVRAVGPCRRVRGQALLARVADGMREWRRSVAELDDKNKK